MRRLISIFLCAVLLISFSACGKEPLDDAFDADTVENVSLDVVDLLLKRKYQDVNDMVPDDLKESLSADVLSSALDDYLYKKGEFKSIKSIDTVGKTSEDGIPYAASLVKVECTSGTAKILVSLNTDYQVVGIYIY